jgi:hypothetical protein
MVNVRIDLAQPEGTFFQLFGEVPFRRPGCRRIGIIGIYSRE